MEQCHQNKKSARMKKIILICTRVFAFLTVTFLITACNKRSDYKNVIDNKTKDTISIFLQGTSA